MSNYQRPPETGPGLRLHLNENTGGCSPQVLDAIRALTAQDIAAYPGYEDVERETAAHLGVDPSWILLVNGLDEGLHLVSALALRPDAGGPKRSVIPEPAFEMYAACTAAAGGEAVRIRPRRDFEFPAGDIRAALLDARTTLVFLTNPNNPTGLAVPSGTLTSLAADAPHATVLVDEAYIDFGGDTVIPHLETHRNLIVGRTFAKAYGLAALRAGCLVAHPDTLAPVRATAPPFSLNVAAAAGLRAAIRDRDWHDNYVRQSHASRQMIYDFCDERGIEHYVSAANFVLVRLGDDAARAVEELAARDIFIRDRSTQPGCAGCVRITAGIVEHTARCLSALEEIL